MIDPICPPPDIYLWSSLCKIDCWNTSCDHHNSFDSSYPDHQLHTLLNLQRRHVSDNSSGKYSTDSYFDCNDFEIDFCNYNYLKNLFHLSVFDVSVLTRSHTSTPCLPLLIFIILIINNNLFLTIESIYRGFGVLGFWGFGVEYFGFRTLILT